MTAILDRVRQLMTLAQRNSFEEEARSAAIAAIRLMRDHKLAVIDPAAPSSLAESPSVPRSRSRSTAPSTSRAMVPSEAYSGGFGEPLRHVPTGDYDVEVADAIFEIDRVRRPTVRIQFRVEEAYEAMNLGAVGLTFVETLVFTNPLDFRVHRFLQASGYDPPPPLVHWARYIVGTKYGVSVVYRPLHTQTPTSLTHVFAYGLSGRRGR